MSVDRLFLDYSIRKLQQAAGRIDECLARLTDEQVWARGSANQNTIGNLTLHVCGNIRQWIVSGVGGAVNDRDRDAEFAVQGGVSVNHLRARLRETVETAIPVIQSQTEESLTRKIQAQNYDIAALEAIYHVVEHFGGHAGQIIFATKMVTGEELGFYKHLKYSSHREKPHKHSQRPRLSYKETTTGCRHFLV